MTQRKKQLADVRCTNGEVAIARGIALSEEPGLGALTLPGFLREVTSRYAPREALVMPHLDRPAERWSYRDLWERSVEIARALIACGAGKDARIGILMTNRLEWVSACFGISLAGGTVVALSTFSTPAELEHLIKASGISTLLFERCVAGKDFAELLAQVEPTIASTSPGALASRTFPYLRRLVTVDDAPMGAIESWDQFLAHGERVPHAMVEARAAAVKPSDAAMLCFSSGSTAQPKGILNAHRGINIQSWRWVRIYGFDTAPVRAWSGNGLFWSGNFSIALGGTLAAGGALILQQTFVPSRALRLLQQERVTFPYCWPHQWAQLEAEPGWEEADLSSFHYFDAERNLRRPQKSITTHWIEPRASYGSTETFTISTAYSVTTPREIWEGNNGEVLPGNTVKIVDPVTGSTLRRGETGEIAVKGPTLMLGYIGIPARRGAR